MMDAQPRKHTMPNTIPAFGLGTFRLKDQVVIDSVKNGLDLGYRVIDTAAGDLGSSAARKYDSEAWVPSQQTYRELTSSSNCTTYQARRLNVRYRDENGKTQTAATLNGTLATTRWLVAILETHQQADGSVRIPAALRPYLGGIEVIEPKVRA